MNFSGLDRPRNGRESVGVDCRAKRGETRTSDLTDRDQGLPDRRKFGQRMARRPRPTAGERPRDGVSLPISGRGPRGQATAGGPQVLVDTVTKPVGTKDREARSVESLVDMHCESLPARRTRDGFDSPYQSLSRFLSASHSHGNSRSTVNDRTPCEPIICRCTVHVSLCA